MKNPKKAFTLTELLVSVVIVIVLAAVVLPKFSKMIEARKTMEAEELMTAVRNEQEARCALGKDYVQLNALGVSKGLSTTKNFTYQNNETGVGAVALASSKKYQLEMPSYVDGRICCSGKGCADLGKKYPTCEELVNKPDYISPNAGCRVEPTKVLCKTPEETTKEDKCGCSGTRTGTWNEAICDYEWGECVGDDPKECDCEEKQCEPPYVKCKCECVLCDAAKNMEPNKDRSACQCKFTKEKCQERGEAYWDNAESKMFSDAPTDNFTTNGAECGCKPCEAFKDLYGYEDKLRFANSETKSLDGTVDTCTNCFYTQEDCHNGTNGATAGTVLKVTSDFPKACVCVSCSEFSSSYGEDATSPDGDGTHCRNCAIEPDSCTGETHFMWTDAQGTPLKNQADFNNSFSYCACMTCAEVTGKENSFWSETQHKCVSCDEGAEWNEELGKCIKCQTNVNDCADGTHFVAYGYGNTVSASAINYAYQKKDDWNAYLRIYGDYACACETCAKITGKENSFWSETQNKCVSCDEGAEWNDDLGQCIKCKIDVNDCEDGTHFVAYGYGNTVSASAINYAYQKKDDWNAYLRIYGDYACACETCAKITGKENSFWSETQHKCVSCDEGAEWNEELGKCIKCQTNVNDCADGTHFVAYGYGNTVSTSAINYAYQKKDDWNAYLRIYGDYACACETCAEMGYSESASWDPETKACRECFPAPTCGENQVLQNAGTKNCACVDCPDGQSAVNGSCSCTETQKNACINEGKKLNPVDCSCEPCEDGFISKDGITCTCNADAVSCAVGQILNKIACQCEDCPGELTSTDGKSCTCNKEASSCASGQILNTTSCQCEDCPEGTAPNDAKTACVALPCPKKASECVPGYLFNSNSYFCECQDCPGELTSTNGTSCTCNKKASDCVPGILDTASCTCKSCFEAHNGDAAYKGVLSTDGETCEARACRTTCTNGLVLVDWGDYAYDQCTCMTCQAAGALKGITYPETYTSTNGKLNTCACRLTCTNAELDKASCSCKTCNQKDPRYNNNFVYKEGQGCVCGLTPQICHDDYDGFYLESEDQGFGEFDCDCFSCTRRGFQNTQSSDGTYKTCNSCPASEPH